MIDNTVAKTKWRTTSDAESFPEYLFENVYHGNTFDYCFQMHLFLNLNSDLVFFLE